MGGGRLKVEKILKTQQLGIHKQLSKNRKQNKKKSRRGKKERKPLLFSCYGSVGVKVEDKAENMGK